MADKERTLTDRVVNSPTVKRVMDAGRQFVTDPLNLREAARAVQAIKKRKNGRTDAGRSSSRR